VILKETPSLRVSVCFTRPVGGVVFDHDDPFPADRAGSCPVVGVAVGVFGQVAATLGSVSASISGQAAAGRRRRGRCGDHALRVRARAVAPEYMIRGGVTYRLITDQLGSVRLVVDIASGATAQRIDYDAWGQVVADTNPRFQPFGYAGGLVDSLTGLVRFGARDYAAGVGRWLTKDPLQFVSDDANLYAYAGADLPNSTDPLGLWGIAFGNTAGDVHANLGSGDPTLLFTEQVFDDLIDGLQATVDGLVPFADPPRDTHVGRTEQRRKCCLVGDCPGDGNSQRITGTGSFLTLTQATINGNSTRADGGGIYNAGTLSADAGTTIFANLALDEGGGIFVAVGATNSLIGTVVTSNNPDNIAFE
jgi:RHS repeat-associated protein